MIRTTTNGVLKTYRYNLQRSNFTLDKARNRVLTQRNFNSFAEDPAAAARCFQMRRSFQRTNGQFQVGESVCRKYDVAWNAMKSIVDDVSNRISDSAYAEVINGLNDATAGGRNALGQSMLDLSKGLVQSMNVKYGDSFVFAGADGDKVPFNMENGVITYRGVPVDTQEPPTLEMAADTKLPEKYKSDGNGGYVRDDASGTFYKTTKGEFVAAADYDKNVEDWQKLNYMAHDEKKFVDIGLGLEEDANGNVMESSAFDSALRGLDMLDFGLDEDGDPKNVISLVNEMGKILTDGVTEDGGFKNPADRTRLERLAKKFEKAAGRLNSKHVEMDTRKGFLDTNQKQLEATATSLQEQFLGLEDADLAEAISSFSWAKYCYDTSLKVGNSILSQSLMDYLNS